MRPRGGGVSLSQEVPSRRRRLTTVSPELKFQRNLGFVSKSGKNAFREENAPEAYHYEFFAAYIAKAPEVETMRE